MSEVLVVEHLISLSHATAILRKFKQKKHANAGYFFELTDLGMSIWDRRVSVQFKHLTKPGSDYPPRYADYTGAVQGYHLKVYRTLP